MNTQPGHAPTHNTFDEYAAVEALVRRMHPGDAPQILAMLGDHREPVAAGGCLRHPGGRRWRNGECAMCGQDRKRHTRARQKMETQP